MFCPRCGMGQPDDQRFCPSCGASLPVHLLERRGPKLSEWFLGLPVHPGDRHGTALRVTRYVEELEVASPEGTVRVPSHHVRFSVWVDDEVVAAVSIADDEAERLADFVRTSAPVTRA